MRVEKDFEDFIKLLNKHNVSYLIVGAYALALFAAPRNTGDIDIFIERSEDNAKKILNVLKEFGFQSLGLTKKDFISKNMIVQLGVQPVRIDIISSISGVKFNEALLLEKKNNLGKQLLILFRKIF